MIDRDALAAFLRRRRELLQPEDVGLRRGPRRRTEGLRREEVAALCHMSTDYYSRLERATGPQPSEQMIASIAQGLHLSLDERDHVFRLAGHNPPSRGPSSEHINPGLLRILDRLDDTPAEIVTEIGETLRQTQMGIALTGDASARQGLDRILGYRWFNDPATRAPYPLEEQSVLSRVYASGLRSLVTLRGNEELDARSREADWGVTSNLSHPGVSATNLLAAQPAMGRSRATGARRVISLLSRVGITGTVDSAALPALMAATDPASRGDQFYGPKRLVGGGPAQRTLWSPLRSMDNARRIWDVSADLVGARFAA
jgi:transcriptional regulator with XRE-family HTH domain